MPRGCSSWYNSVSVSNKKFVVERMAGYGSFFSCLFLGCCFCETQVILHDDIFETDFKFIGRQYDNKGSLVLIKIHRNITLDEETLIASSLESTNNTIFSFTERVNLRKRPNVFSFGTSIKQLSSKTLAYHANNCLRFTVAYRRSIVAIIYSLFLKKIAIITDDSYCSKWFLDDIKNDLRLYTDANSELYLFTVISSWSNENKELFAEQFYTLKTRNVNLIALLVPVEHYPKVFEITQHFSLLRSPNTWLIPSYYDGVLAKCKKFRRIISFSETFNEHLTYANLRTAVPRMMQIYSDLHGIQSSEDILFRLYTTLLRDDSIQSRFFQLAIQDRTLNDNESFSTLNLKAIVTPTQFRLTGRESVPLLRTVTKEGLLRHIRAVTVISKPFVFDDSDSFDSFTSKCSAGLPCTYKTRHTCCVGFGISLFMLIVEELNLDVDMYVVEDGNYGVVDDNGRWNGMIADVVSGKADIAVGAITITSIRSTVVDFSVPYLEQEVGILTKPEEEVLRFINWEFISPLSGELQLFLWFTVISLMLLNYLFENNIYFASLGNAKYINEEHYPIFESMTYIGGVTLQRDLGGKNPYRLGARATALVFAFGMVIIVTTYTAMLAAQSVQNQEKDPFIGSKDSRMRNPTDDFKFALLKSSSYETFFKYTENAVFKRMGLFMEKYNVETTLEGVERVKNGSLDAFIDDYAFAFWHASHDNDCKLQLLKDTIAKSGYGFPINKKFSWSRSIDDTILRLKEQGVFEPLQKKWFAKFCQPQFYVTTETVLSINHFGGLVIVLYATMVFCFPLLLPERFYYKYMQNVISDYLKSKFKTARLEESTEEEAFEQVPIVIRVNRMGNRYGPPNNRHEALQVYR